VNMDAPLLFGLPSTMRLPVPRLIVPRPRRLLWFERGRLIGRFPSRWDRRVPLCQYLAVIGTGGEVTAEAIAIVWTRAAASFLRTGFVDRQRSAVNVFSI
jgi:hypothetical protein